MKRQIDNPPTWAVTEGGGGGHYLALTREVNLRHTIIRQFRGRNQRLRSEVIPVPDRLGEEDILIDIFTSSGYLKVQGVLISAAPSLGNKVICRYPGFTFQTFV